MMSGSRYRQVEGCHICGVTALGGGVLSYAGRTYTLCAACADDVVYGDVVAGSGAPGKRVVSREAAA